MTMAEKAKTFVAQFVALVEGDNAKALAESTKRRADAILKQQLATEKAVLLEQEELVKEAESGLSKALLNNGRKIESGTMGREAYVNNLVEANERLATAQENLESTQNTIEFLNSQIDLIK